MSIGTYAVISGGINGGKVVNVIVYDGVAEYDPGDGFTLVRIPEGSGAGIGWTYDKGEFVPPKGAIEE